MSDVILGRKAASNGDVGVGETAQNELRVTLLAQPTEDYWLTHLGAHVGWDGAGTPPHCTIAAYWSSDHLPTTKAGQVGPFETRAYYPPRGSYSGGEDREGRLATPIILMRNWAIYGGVHARYRWMTHGMAYDGYNMSRDYDNLVVPTKFTIDRRDAQGRMTVWARAEKNLPPAAPSSVAPAPGGQTTSTRPSIQGDFRDPNEELTGFSIGHADKMSAFQVLIFNATRTGAPIHDSGVVGATAQQRTSRRFSWAPPSNLASGATYTVQARVRDDVGVWSTTTEWKFSVVAGGAAVVTAPNGRQTTQIPTGAFTYSHRDGVPMKSIRFQYRARGTDAALTPIGEYIMSVPSGGSGTIPYPGDWVVLPRGTDAHLFVQPIDNNGVAGAWSDWTQSQFRVNALPPAPSNLSPAAGDTRTTPGVFRLTAGADADGDPPSGYFADVWIRKTSAPTVLQGFTMRYVRMEGSLAVFEGSPPAAFMNTYESYEWSAQMHDQYGEVGGWSGYVSFSFAKPPAITITAPGNTVGVATPTVTFTSDPVASQQRIRWVDSETKQVKHDSKLVAATGSDQVVSGEIRNGRTYDVVVGVLTGLGAYSEVKKTVTVAFPRPATLTSQVLTLVSGKFDSPGVPTVFRLTFADPDLDETAFQGYGFYVKEGSGAARLVAIDRNRTTTTYVPEIPRLDTTVTMWATRFNRIGDDIVESDPPVTPPTSAMPYFGGTIISDLANPGENRVVAAWWLSRKEIPVRASEQRDGWGTYPITSVGERNYERIEGQWDVIDEVGFSSVELKDAMKRLADPIEEHRMIRGRMTKILRPRKLCYRDATGRRLFGKLEIENAEDTHREDRNVTWRFTETGPMPTVRRPTLGDPEEDQQIQALQGLLSGQGGD